MRLVNTWAIICIVLTACNAEWHERETEKGNFDAMLSLEHMAKTGDAEAMYYLGNIYYSGKAAEIESRISGKDVTRDYDKAIALYKNAVKKGNIDAMRSLEHVAKVEDDSDLMYSLGQMYYYGNDGIEQDYIKAIKWYEQVAVKGNSEAMVYLGDIYYTGKGVTQDYAKSIEWYENAATYKNPEAMYYLGNIYYSGEGAKQDYTKAVEWYVRAVESEFVPAVSRDGSFDPMRSLKHMAEEGNIEAMYSLGNIYYNGKGDIKRDIAKTIEWYERAAGKGDLQAMRSLGKIYYNDKNVERDIAKAVEWYERAANEGDLEAMRSLGKIYYNSEDVKSDFAKAIEWYERAAGNGDLQAMEYLGDMYCEGGYDGSKKDYAKAMAWYKYAIEQGSYDAMNRLGDMYENGHYVTQNYEEAIEWYKRAVDKGGSEVYLESAIGRREKMLQAEREAKAGDPDAMYSLGDMYYVGEGVTANHAKAMQWYERAAEKGHADAMDSLGYMYRIGDGVKRDYAKAIEWYKRSIDANIDGNHSYHAISHAKYVLGTMYYDGKNYTAAKKWFDEAAILDDHEESGYHGRYSNYAAMAMLGKMYENGHGVKQDYAEAIAWYKDAVELDCEAGYRLGYMYENGKGVKKNITEALRWYEYHASDYYDANEYDQKSQAAIDRILNPDVLNSDALNSFGDMYYVGKDVVIDYAKAKILYEQAAAKGNSAAMDSLSKMYRIGQGVKRDEAKAAEWHKLAVETDYETFLKRRAEDGLNGEGVKLNDGYHMTS